MKFLHLLPLVLLATNFSGVPAPEKPKIAVAAFVGKWALPLREEDKEIIPWITERRLAWDDFLCAPQKQGDAVASTSTSLGISYQVKNGKLGYSISCNFAKQKSWGLLRTEYILKHEQAHFDITELHARKLYAALSDYQFNPATFKKDIADIYDRIIKEKEAMQEAYDSETDHSRRRHIQYEWLDRIEQLLQDTEAFAQYP